MAIHILGKKEKISIKMDLKGFEEISTFGPKTGSKVYIKPDLIASVASFFRYPNGGLNKHSNDKLLESVMVHLVVKKIDGEHYEGYRYYNWLSQRTSENPSPFSKCKIYGFSGPSTVTLEIFFSPQAIL